MHYGHCSVLQLFSVSEVKSERTDERLHSLAPAPFCHPCWQSAANCALSHTAAGHTPGELPSWQQQRRQEADKTKGSRAFCSCTLVCTFRFLCINSRDQAQTEFTVVQKWARTKKKKKRTERRCGRSGQEWGVGGQTR